jgi:putative oxidoreductase
MNADQNYGVTDPDFARAGINESETKHGDKVEEWGLVILRVSAGLTIFYVHGWHKLGGWMAYLQHGTPWKLAEEVAGMHFPAPLVSAVAATMVQSICSLFIVVGLFTRINAALLVGVLGVAILQNLLSDRDPLLAILYTVIVFTLLLAGGGRFSLDAWLKKRRNRAVDSNPLNQTP